MSLFVSILKGEYDALLAWPFAHNVHVTLLDQSDNVADRRDVQLAVRPSNLADNAPFLARPQHERNASFGAQKFVDLALFELISYVKDDAMLIKLQVDGSDMNVL